MYGELTGRLMIGPLSDGMEAASFFPGFPFLSGGDCGVTWTGDRTPLVRGPCHLDPIVSLGIRAFRQRSITSEVNKRKVHVLSCPNLERTISPFLVKSLRCFELLPSRKPSSFKVYSTSTITSRQSACLSQSSTRFLTRSVSNNTPTIGVVPLVKRRI